MKALVVDDSLTMLTIQRRALEGAGWTVLIARDGEEALKILAESEGIDLMLTDWHMPGMDGISLVREVRRLGRYPGLRILMVTSDGVLDSVQTAIDAGADDFLIKPFTHDALIERITELMNA